MIHPATQRLNALDVFCSVVGLNLAIVSPFLIFGSSCGIILKTAQDIAVCYAILNACRLTGWLFLFASI
jgi:hypothetical protein